MKDWDGTTGVAWTFLDNKTGKESVVRKRHEVDECYLDMKPGETRTIEGSPMLDDDFPRLEVKCVG